MKLFGLVEESDEVTQCMSECLNGADRRQCSIKVTCTDHRCHGASVWSEEENACLWSLDSHVGKIYQNIFI